MRLFIALDLPEQVRKAAAEIIARLKPYGADVKWVRPENLHVTLKFLGEVKPELVSEIGQALEGACVGQGPLELSLSEVGAFPKPSRPKVVWLSMAGQVDELAALAKRVEQARGPLGFEPEARAFKTHLTIGRLRRPRKGKPRPSPVELARELAAMDGPHGPEFIADTVALIKSDLRPTGPIYTPVHQVTLS